MGLVQIKKKAVKITAFLHFKCVLDLPATGGGLFGLSLVHAQGAAVNFFAVKGRDGVDGAAFVHFNKTEATGAAGFAIRNQVHGKNIAVGLEESLNAVLSGRPGQITDINRSSHVRLQGVKGGRLSA